MKLELTIFCEMLATSNNKIFFCAKLDGGAFEHGISTKAKMFFGQLPRVSGEDPERIRVDSVVETFDCLSDCSLFFVCSFLVSKFSHFPSFNLLFLYSTVQKSAVQYRYLFGASIL